MFNIFWTILTWKSPEQLRIAKQQAQAKYDFKNGIETFVDPGTFKLTRAKKDQNGVWQNV